MNIRRAVALIHAKTDLTGSLPDILLELGIGLEVVCVEDDLPDPKVLELLFVMGSIDSAYDDSLPWLQKEMAWLRQVIDNGTPVLGICFGSQLIARVLGGSVSRNHRPEIGWCHINTPANGWVHQGPWLNFHFDAFTAPPTAELLGCTELAQQVFRQGQVMGVQFHPEITPAMFDTWTTSWRETEEGRRFLKEVGDLPERLRREIEHRQPENRANLKRMLQDFLQSLGEPCALTGQGQCIAISEPTGKAKESKMSQNIIKDWETHARELQIEGRCFINGQYREARQGQTFDCISPIDQRLLVKVASCDQDDAELAVSSARQAFESGVWSRLAPTRRKAVLLRFADLIAEHAEELALLETLDMGKPIGDSLAVDVPATERAIRWSAEAIDKIYDEVAATAHNELGLVTREPVGVVAAIVPWNFPMMMACWKLGPALATGNSVILKPSEKSPLTAIRLAALALEAGLPAGVLNVLPGYGHTVGKALALHMDVDTLVFTGSSRIAKQLMVYAGESNMKRVWLEAGGKSPNIVFADAPDLDEAARAAAAAIAFNQGEVCTAGSRLLVEASIKDMFVEKVASALQETWQPGHPLDPDARVGALVDQGQTETVLDYIRSAQEEGARLVVGGRQVRQESGGFFVEPTLFDQVTSDMRIAREEIFGPVLSVMTFESFEEAIAIANDTIYGLAAAVWTRDLSKAHLASKALRAGSVWVNQYDGGDMTAPFGGFKQSGNGRDKSLHAFDKYTELKATWIKL